MRPRRLSAGVEILHLAQTLASWESGMSKTFTVRRATLVDVAVIARHRAAMFKDMGELPADLYDELVEASTRYLEAAIPSEEYVEWVAALHDAPQQIVAGAGVQRRRILPRPLLRPGVTVLAGGQQGIVLNVFTERPWRRRGLAELLMRHVLAWVKSAGLDTPVLHASADGRRLYERLGFVPTNEMRYAGNLLEARVPTGDPQAD
jgi:GNAT superfamily N-acetyltransferase